MKNLFLGLLMTMFVTNVFAVESKNITVQVAAWKCNGGQKDLLLYAYHKVDSSRRVVNDVQFELEEGEGRVTVEELRFYEVSGVKRLSAYGNAEISGSVFSTQHFHVSMPITKGGGTFSTFGTCDSPSDEGNLVFTVSNRNE